MLANIAKCLMSFIFLAAAGNVISAENRTAKKKPFIVIDSISYKGKARPVPGMKDYTILYAAHIWPKDIRKKERKPVLPPSDELISGLVKNITADKSPVIYDIEHWPLDIRKNVSKVADDDIDAADNKSVDASIKKMIYIINCSRKANPSVKYGYYACIPLRDYWAPVHNKPGAMEAWKKANDYLKPLADSVDVICPSIYTFFNKPSDWVKYAKANIAEAKRLANGKPVYVYLWPKYHVSNKEDRCKFIDGDFWKLQLETVYNSGVDGIIIWDNWRLVASPEEKIWNPQLPWWKETVKFLKRIK
jgi:hypothetical protein